MASTNPQTDAQTFHDVNVILDKLQAEIGRARYGQGRSGMVPPEAIPYTLKLVEDAHETLKALTTPAPEGVRRFFSLNRG